MIKVRNLKKEFRDGEIVTKVLKGIDLDVKYGEFIAVMGRSGAGKSTLLYQISLLDEPTSGIIEIDGTNTHELKPSDKVDYRLRNLGYVFQDFALLPDLTALENVALPMLMQGQSKNLAYEEAEKTLIEVDLKSRLNYLPSNLSGGEQQRVSIARAIASKPKILFADEPTANLDNLSSRMILDIFKKIHNNGQTIIMVTHEEEFGRVAEKIIRLDDGKII